MEDSGGMDHHQLARTLAAGRIAIGGSLLALPGLAGRTWVGGVASDGAAKVFIRAFGIRELALGAGTLGALDSGAPPRSWLLWGATCDVADAAITLVAWRHIGWRRAVPVLAFATAATAVGVVAAENID